MPPALSRRPFGNRVYGYALATALLTWFLFLLVDRGWIPDSRGSLLLPAKIERLDPATTEPVVEADITLGPDGAFRPTAGAHWYRIRFLGTSRPQVLSLHRFDFEAVDLRLDPSDAASALPRLRDRLPAFALCAAGHPPEVVHLYLQSPYEARLELRGWDSEASFYHARRAHAGIIGLYLGVLAILLLLNFFISLTTRHRVYRDYSLFLLFHGLSTIAYEGLYLATPLAGIPAIHQVLLASIPLSLTCVVGFLRHFLDLAQTQPRVDRGLRGLQVILLALLVQIPLLLYPPAWSSVIRLQTTLALATVGAIVVVSLLKAKHGRLPELLLLLAFIPHAFAVGSFVMARLGLLANDENFYYKLILGSLFEMVLLALALAVQIRKVEHERQEALEASVASLQRERAAEARYRAQLEGEVAERTADLMQSLQEKDRLLSILAHDLRSPLNSIIRISQFALRDRPAADPDSAYEILGSIHHTGRELYRLLDNLLAWARLNWGQLEPHLEIVDLGVVCQRCERLFAAQIEEKEQRWIRSAPAELAGHGDRELLELVLRNLFSNAVRHAPRGARVEITFDREASVLHCSMANEGAAIPAEAVARFQREDGVPDRPATGTGQRLGLGLLLCRDALELLDGRLEISHREGFGPVVAFSLPFPPPPTS